MNSFENQTPKILPQEHLLKKSREYLSNGAKRRILKERFRKNEGSYKTFDSSEVSNFRHAVQEVGKLTEAESRDYSDEQKVAILKEILFDLAKKINGEIPVSQEQINTYVEKKKRKILGYFAKLQATLRFIDYLDNSGIFAYKLRTSGYEITKTTQDDIAKKENIAFYLNNLFAQSVYYVTPSGMTIRVKLSEIKAHGTKIEDILQPPMEQIFYNNRAVEYLDRKNDRLKEIVKVTDTSPEVGKFVFEIATPKFEQLLQSQEELRENSIKSWVGVIQNNEGININIPDGSTLHSGWKLVGVDNINSKE